MKLYDEPIKCPYKNCEHEFAPKRKYEMGDAFVCPACKRWINIAWDPEDGLLQLKHEDYRKWWSSGGKEIYYYEITKKMRGSDGED